MKRKVTPEVLVYAERVWGDSVLIAERGAVRHAAAIASALAEMATVAGALSVLRSPDEDLEPAADIFVDWLETSSGDLRHRARDPDAFDAHIEDGEIADAFELLPPEATTGFEPVTEEGYPRWRTPLDHPGLGVPEELLELGEIYDDAFGVTSVAWPPGALPEVSRWCEEHGVRLEEDAELMRAALE